LPRIVVNRGIKMGIGIEYLIDPVFITAAIIFILTWAIARAFMRRWDELRKEKLEPALWELIIYVFSVAAFTLSGLVVLSFKLRYLWHLTDQLFGG